MLLAAFLIRVYRLGDPFGGYHSFNEAHYTLQGVRYLAKSVGDFIVNPVDTNNPPLFSFLLYLVFRLFGVSEAAARFVPVAFSLVAVYFTYLLGMLFYNRRVGILAALFLALMPGFVLVTRNVQGESVYTAFILISLYLFISRGTENVFWAAGAGAVFGLGILTKMPTVVIMPALVGWHIWRQRRLAWPTFRPLAVYAGAAFLTVLPYYGYQMLFNSKAFFGAQGHLAGTISIPSVTMFLSLALNLFWLLSPALSVALLASTVWLLFRRSEADVFILLVIGSYLGFFFFYHFHSYYVIPLAPFAALAVGWFFDSALGDGRVLAGVAAALALFLLFFAFLMLAGNKYGSEFSEAESFIPPDIEVIETKAAIKNNYGPVLEYYFPTAELRVDDEVDHFPRGKRIYALAYSQGDLENWARAGKPGFYFLNRQVDKLVLFGYAFSQSPPSFHNFISGPIEISRTASPTTFGWHRSRVPFFVLIDPLTAGWVAGP